MKAIFSFNNSGDPEKLAAFCAEMGIDSAILSPKFFETDNFQQALRHRDIKIWMNIPVLYNKQYLMENADAYSITSQGNRAVHSWLHMVCPSRQRYLDILRQETKRVIKRVCPDFISYDFLRFFVFWEEAKLDALPDHIEHGCYCKECRQGFRRFSGEEISIENGIIEKSQREILGKWKTGVINGIAEEVIAMAKDCGSDIPVYIKTVPWRQLDFGHGLAWIAGQDIQSLGSMADGLAPMAFTQILGQTPAWKKEVLDQVREITGREVISYIQFEPVLRDTPITPAQIEEEIKAAHAEKRAGLIYFHYEQIAGNPEKQAVLKKYRSL